ncbi:putative GTPase-activating protein [Venturia nashicola]|uniref:Putative GTPase-activating protein n=1 Tax=Venturia nashicola TaxID=86259 RepID=A0A4Z1PEJ5_9PEZI|nr:putative GTPase-activating protein [Venturia nashicola]
MSAFPSYGERIGPWQEKLNELCIANGFRPPIYQIASDRRGGRTAWSSTVEVQGTTIPARYWYDGQYVHNAKEDAAQVALERLKAGYVPHAQYQHAQQHGQGQHHQHQKHWSYSQSS